MTFVLNFKAAAIVLFKFRHRFDLPFIMQFTKSTKWSPNINSFVYTRYYDCGIELRSVDTTFASLADASGAIANNAFQAGSFRTLWETPIYCHANTG